MSELRGDTVQYAIRHECIAWRHGTALVFLEGHEWVQISCDKAYLNKASGKGKQSTWEDQADLALGRDLGGEMSYSFNA